MKNKILVSLLLVVLAVSLIMFGACAKAPEAEKPIKIGGLHARTGFISDVGTFAYQGGELCLEHAGYRVAGRPIEWIAEDIASDATITMDKARKLVEMDGVAIIHGPLFTPGIDAIGPYVSRMEVPLLTNSCLTESQALAGWQIWSHAAYTTQRTYPLGVYAYEGLGYRTATTLAPDFQAMREYIQGFIAGFKDSGGTIVQEQYYPIEAVDFIPYISKLVDADVLATAITGTAVIPAFTQFAELKVQDKMDILCSPDVSLFDEDIMEEIGPSVVGIMGESHYHWSSSSPGNKEFVDAYKAKYNKWPPSFAGMGYITMQIILDAIERTGGDVSYDALCQAIDNTNLQTIRGIITFGSFGLGHTDSQIMNVTGPTTLEVSATYHSWTEKVGDKLVIKCEKAE